MHIKDIGWGVGVAFGIARMAYHRMSKTVIILTGSFKYGIYSITWNVIVNKKLPIISINVEKLFLLSHNIVDVLESLFKWLDIVI